jgi:SAM-dependent methyltransferase
MMKISQRKIEDLLTDIAKEYPSPLREAQLQDVKRIAFNISLISIVKGTSCRVCDIGGGIGLFSAGCAALGMKSVLVDDFSDDINRKSGDSVLNLHRRLGVEVMYHDVIRDGLEFPAENFDAVTTFDSMEHWHHSPKRLFKQVYDMLKAEGLFVLGVPNCVNLRKRITVPLGLGKWSSMSEWYEADIFRGHVREPDVDDLRYIARDMNLSHVRIVGRNWLGYQSKFSIVRTLTPFADHILRLLPSICSDIYMIGTKK